MNDYDNYEDDGSTTAEKIERLERCARVLFQVAIFTAFCTAMYLGFKDTQK